MPPKRGRLPGRGRGTPRAPSRARGTPGPSGLDGLHESQSPPPSSEARVRVQRTPGPAKYSTSYGSPSTLVTTRRVNAGTAMGSIDSALDNVQIADEEDRQNRTARLAAEARSRGEPAPSQAPVQSLPAVEEDGSDYYGVGSPDQALQAMPPPPRPRQSQRSTRGSSSAANTQRASQGSRAASVQPDSSRPGASAVNTGSNTGRLGSEPLHSDALSHRSFIEESELYGAADVATPTQRRPSAQPINVPEVLNPQQPASGLRRSPRRHHQPQQKQQQEQQQQSPSPTRAAATTAARTGADRVDSMSPPASEPTTRGNQKSSTPSTESDSIDEDDEEDPLLNPTPRGLRAGRGSSAASQTRAQSKPVQGGQPLDITERIQGIEEYVSLNRNKNSASNMPGTGDEEASQTLGMPGNRAQSRLGGLQQSRWRNPLQDARSGGFLLPRPDRAGSHPPPEGDSTAGPATGLRVPGTSEQSVFSRFRSPSPITSSTGGTGRSTQQSNLDGSKRPGGSPPRAEGNSTTSSATGSRPSATLGQPASPPSRSASPSLSPISPPVSSYAGVAGESFQQSRISGPGKVGNFPAGDSTQADRRFFGDNYQQRPNNNYSNGAAPAAAGPGADIDEGRLTRVLNWFRWVFDLSNWPPKLRRALEFYAIFVLLCWGFLIMLEICLPTKRWEGIQVSKDYQYYGMSLENWRQNILQFVPWIVLHPFATLTGNLDYADFRDQLSRMELKEHSSAIKMKSIAAATNQMRRILPELIKINVGERRGDWAIDDWFWHVLNEEMAQGSFAWSLLTAEKSQNGSYTISDAHWDAIRQRIQNERLLISDRPAASGEDPLAVSNEVINYVELSVSKAFQDWLAQNERDVRRVTGKNEGSPSANYKDLYGDVEKIVAERLNALGLQESVVTKDKFIEKMEHEFDQREAYIKEEMKRLHEKLGQALGIAIDAKNSAEIPPGMSRHEVSQLVDESVRRAIADAQLEAMAKGSIKSHLSNELNQRKNYFSALRGAIVDPKLTSDTYDWRPERVVKQEKSLMSTWSTWITWGSGRNSQPVYRGGGISSGLPFAPSFVLDKWEEDGECWCAGHGDANNITRAADLSIFPTEPVIPQHLVVEHIGRGATFDPEAMPKDIEFWIQPPSDKRARTLYDWSKSKWADVKHGPGARLIEKGFLKVGEFRFDAGIGKGESQVFKLSDELLGMDAQTRQVLVRAKSNYGAEDHTCFYRLRLFGEEGRGRSRGGSGSGSGDALY